MQENRFIPTYMGNAVRYRIRRSVPAVHPHVHGERIDVFRHGGSQCGSSPRTWGTHRRRLSATSWYRFIPTYMGNASTGLVCIVPTPVHPHVHGERFLVVCQRNGTMGSSPRTWGTRVVHFVLRVVHRFIPTYMGNARTRRSTRPAGPVHPHVHGERSARWYRVHTGFGSSPRTWGTRRRRLQPGVSDRFIPTYMGNAYRPLLSLYQVPVHPHVHGERQR